MLFRSLAYSPVAGAVFVAHGADGRITALAAGSGEVLNEVRLGVPLGAVYAAPDGRTLLALATEQRQLLVVDAANLAVRHRIALAAEPYQLAFTAGFAHVRMYDTDRIALVALAALNEIVWRTQTTDFWVAFKVWGIMPLTIVFALAQVPLILKYEIKQPEA